MKEEETEYILVAQYFHPDTASTGQLMTDLSVGLRKRGMDLTVYTTQPNYHSGDFDKQPRVERHEGVFVKRIRAPQFKQTSLFRRAFNWFVYTIWMAIVLLISSDNGEREVVFVSNPPFFGIAMWSVCRLRNWDYTYIIYDLWPEKGIEFGFYSEGGWIDRLWSFFHTQVLRDAKRIVVLGPKMREQILEYDSGNNLEDKVRIVDNWADADFIEPREKSKNWFSKKHGLVNTFSLVYSGNIGLFHDLETVIRASTKFDPEDLQILIIGEGDNKESMVKLAERLGVRGNVVNFLPYQPREYLPYSLTSADVSIVTVEKGFEGTCVSSKLYTALAVGQPVLVVAQPDCDEARIINKYNAGEQVSPGDANGLKETIHRWKDDPNLVEQQGKNARQAFENNFTKEISIGKYYDVLTDDLKYD